jgi:hypothetical protein
MSAIAIILLAVADKRRAFPCHLRSSGRQSFSLAALLDEAWPHARHGFG